MLLKMVEPVTKNMENLSNYIIGNVYRVAALLILQLNVALILPAFNIYISGLIRYNRKRRNSTVVIRGSMSPFKAWCFLSHF